VAPLFYILLHYISRAPAAAQKTSSNILTFIISGATIISSFHGGFPVSKQSQAAARLRQLLQSPEFILMPCCYDAFSARLIERAGFSLTFMSGFAVSAARLGLLDTGEHD
jgi:hypothetical protein